MKKITNEFKVGLFVILCVLGLVYLTYSTGKLNIKKEGYHIYVVFNEVAGLEKKAPVMLNGLEIGKVDDIKPSYDNDRTQITLKLWVNKEAKIRENPVITIKTLGLMGEKYIHIASSNGRDFIEPEAILEGKPYLDLDALLQEAQTISKDISQQVNKLVVSLNNTVDDNKGNVSSIIKNLEATSKNFEDFSADIKSHPWKLLFKTKEKPQKK
ncbi:MAG: MlaD family protein [Candidatus Omnitrophica bacterium]|nr:MlaD family protein [Candidatus Omnitrophota bacterium]MDD5237850.1 MlaD family protein [Candidatus Omnitrophota bacterium]